jgi:hypothetical protein
MAGWGNRWPTSGKWGIFPLRARTGGVPPSDFPASFLDATPSVPSSNAPKNETRENPKQPNLR